MTSATTLPTERHLKRKRVKTHFQVGRLYTTEPFPHWVQNGVQISSYARCGHDEIKELSSLEQSNITMYGFWKSGTDPDFIWYRLPRTSHKLYPTDPLLCVDTLVAGAKKNGPIGSRTRTHFAMFMVGEGKFSVLSVRETVMIPPDDNDTTTTKEKEETTQ